MRHSIKGIVQIFEENETEDDGHKVHEMICISESSVERHGSLASVKKRAYIYYSTTRVKNRN